MLLPDPADSASATERLPLAPTATVATFSHEGEDGMG
jgi:hypothetical protein